MKIQHWPLDRLKPFPNNPRIISDEAVEKVAASIAEFGFQQPIVVDKDGEIIVGHNRLLAAQKLALPKVPVVVAAELTEAQVRAYRIADNKTAEYSEWDVSRLVSEIIAIEALGITDMSLTGFSAQEIGELMDQTAAEAEPEPDPPVPSMLAEPVSKPGDIWILGDHRIICGDCTQAHVVEALLQHEKPNLMVTDPPYGVEYDPAWRNEARGVNSKQSKRVGNVLNDNRADWYDAWVLFPGNIVYIWHGALHAGTVQESLTRAGFGIRSQIIWAKPNFALSRGDYHWKHEPCWYAVRENAKGDWHGDRSQTTLWEIATGGQDEDTTHGTQKPVECMKRPILNNTPRGGGSIRAFFRQRHDHHCRRADRSTLLCYRIEPWICGRGCAPLDEAHRQGGDPCRNRKFLARDRKEAGNPC